MVKWIHSKSLLLVFLLAALSIACNHRVLSFFFDGVPDPKSKTPEMSQPEQRMESVAVYATRTLHAPYAEKACEACHRPEAANTLVAPAEELCFLCHDLELNKKYVHGPLASGGCLVCHDPHKSAYPSLLVSKSDTFCFYCHDQNAIAGSETHSQMTEQCTTCHEPHMSDNEYLLK